MTVDITSIVNSVGEQIDLRYSHKSSEFIEPVRSFSQTYVHRVYFRNTPGYLGIIPGVLKIPERVWAGPGTIGFNNHAGPRVEHDNILLEEIQFPKGLVRINYSEMGEREDIHNSYFVKSIETYGSKPSNSLIESEAQRMRYWCSIFIIL